MDEISKLTSALAGGTLPEGYNPKAIEKLRKHFQKLSEARIIRNYPIRRFLYSENFYSVYAFPIKGTEIAQETLAQIKASVATLDYGSMRYDSMMEPEAGKHTKVYAKRPTNISMISDAFDGVVIYTLPEYGIPYRKAALRHDIPYVLLGKKAEPDQFELHTIKQSDLGLPASEIIYENYTTGPEDSARYQLIAKIIAAVVVIGYLIYRYLLS